MTDLTTTPSTSDALPLQAPSLPRYGTIAAIVFAIAVGALVSMVIGAGYVAALVIAWLVLVVALPLWSLAVEGGRKAVDRVATLLIWSTFGLAMIPLVSLIYTVISKGSGILSGQFFNNSMRNVLGEGGGIYHAIFGTLIVTALAAAISVPIGILTAIYLVEYGKGKKLARVITFLVDVMTGIPSIVAGLFAYALFVLIFGPGVRLGIGGSVALSVLMIPIVVRSSEEMLKLVPDELREASYALGVPKWRTIVKVVVPTAIAGIVTGVTLAIARVAGETAPLLIIAGFTTDTNLNPFSDRMTTLPVYIFQSIASPPGLYRQEYEDYAWGAALTLVTIVMLLNVLARVIGAVFAPKSGR
ncbi:phosphate ABC transporter permease PstA [Nocardioides sp.]|uniref:phosphate ABC transporter permease PstA n=1 Tax=Nocardioides sp. TaxID=35761 RepID=UPI000C98CB31|nr:phosphate ABC transporter permease PstA [Nocardioides sp.]MAS55392.1 phosphate ABC transporter, permease protein PstA [Pimelobacter sp.]MDE0776557.1 phosphate ABC transporter permease PstA [Nocardioides sp.]